MVILLHKTFEHLKHSFGGTTLGKITVFDWYKRFKSHGDTIEGANNVGQPVRMRTEAKGVGMHLR